MRIATAISLPILASNSITAFSPVGNVNTNQRYVTSRRMQNRQSDDQISCFDPLGYASAQLTDDSLLKTASVMASTAAAIALFPGEAHAAGPDWGIFEGRTGSLLHPVMMGSMLLFSLSTGLMGFQYRRQRTIGAEINALKKTLPKLNGSSTLSETIAQAKSADEVDAALVLKLESAIPIQESVDAMLLERKDLSSMGLKDKHFSQGALLAFLGTSFAIEGPLNTYARAGKLFPGPHLYAGAGLVVLWAAATACVPHMQKGNDTARSVHIAANVSAIGLFGWQVVSGWPILMKVLEKTSWP